jgi:hypothetical protein
MQTVNHWIWIIGTGIDLFGAVILLAAIGWTSHLFVKRSMGEQHYDEPLTHPHRPFRRWNDPRRRRGTLATMSQTRSTTWSIRSTWKVMTTSLPHTYKRMPREETWRLQSMPPRHG